MDEDDIMIIPAWMFHESSLNGDESSLLIQCNMDCIIEKPSLDEESLLLQSRRRSVKLPPPRPQRTVDYIQVFHDFLET